jgi:hypothetical protein
LAAIRPKLGGRQTWAIDQNEALPDLHDVRFAKNEEEFQYD